MPMLLDSPGEFEVRQHTLGKPSLFLNICCCSSTFCQPSTRHGSSQNYKLTLTLLLQNGSHSAVVTRMKLSQQYWTREMVYFGALKHMLKSLFWFRFQGSGFMVHGPCRYRLPSLTSKSSGMTGSSNQRTSYCSMALEGREYCCDDEDKDDEADL